MKLIYLISRVFWPGLKRLKSTFIKKNFLTPQVTPFVAADFDNENPYDNMSQHTTETTTKDGDDIISVKSAAGTKSPIPGKLELGLRN